MEHDNSGKYRVTVNNLAEESWKDLINAWRTVLFKVLHHVLKVILLAVLLLTLKVKRKLRYGYGFLRRQQRSGE